MEPEMDRDNVLQMRRSNRHALILPAKCRTRSGFLDHVVISDISAGGCRIDSLGLVMGVGDLVVVRPEGLEGLCGVIRWIKGHSAGIEFERPLYPAVVDHLHRTFLRLLTPQRPAELPGKLQLAA